MSQLDLYSVTRAVGCDPTRMMTRACEAECTVEWADLWVGLTCRVNDSQVVHPSGWAFHEMGHSRHRI